MSKPKNERHKVEEDIMGRDPEILDQFEFADYLMQDVLGYYLYVNASVQSAPSEDKISGLPEKAMPLTHSWNIYYSPEALVKKMDKNFYFHHTRSSLLSLVSIFEVTLRSFVKRLEDEEKIDKFGEKNKKYRTLLKWVVDFVISNKESLYGGPGNEDVKKMIQRVPDLCCIIDEARRLRNLFMHHRGLFHKSYEEQAIPINGKIKLHPQYLKFRENPKQKVPVLLKPEEFIQCSRSHIELLHELHDLIQRKYFGLTGGGYYYKQEWERLEQKRAEWGHILTG